MNRYQKELCRVYEHGEYAHIKTKQEAANAGDTLFTFLFNELSDEEGCCSSNDAVDRVMTIMEQVGTVANAVIDEATK